MPEMQHHRYSPSKLERIILCPGSVSLSDEYPQQETSSYAEEGTLLHAYVTECLDLYPDMETMETKVIENPEHRGLVKDVMEQVQCLIDSMDGAYDMIYDQRVAMPDVDVEGTLDFAIFNEAILHVVDFKFGGGVEVSPVQNPQLMAYASGALQIVLKKYPNWYGEVYLHIFQPSMDSYPRWQVFEEDLIHFSERVEHAIRLAESKNPPLHPGTAQCRWCPAGGSCRVRHTKAQELASLALAEVADIKPISDNQMQIDQLAKILQTRKQVETAFNQIEAYLLQQLTNGASVPGFKLTTGRSSRKWRSHVDAFLLAEKFGLDEVDLLDTKLRSPAQVEKLIPKKDRARLSDYYDTLEGGLSIASELSNKKTISSPTEHAFREVADSNDSGITTSYVALD